MPGDYGYCGGAGYCDKCSAEEDDALAKIQETTDRMAGATSPQATAPPVGITDSATSRSDPRSGIQDPHPPHLEEMK